MRSGAALGSADLLVRWEWELTARRPEHLMELDPRQDHQPGRRRANIKHDVPFVLSEVHTPAEDPAQGWTLETDGWPTAAFPPDVPPHLFQQVVVARQTSHHLGPDLIPRLAEPGPPEPG